MTDLTRANVGDVRVAHGVEYVAKSTNKPDSCVGCAALGDSNVCNVLGKHCRFGVVFVKKEPEHLDKDTLLKEAVAAVKMLCKECEGYDLPYGSEAYLAGNIFLNKARKLK